MKPLVLYHANCTDGFGAAFAAWLKFDDEAEYIPMNYGEVKTPTDFDMKVSLAAKGNDIYILGFSFPREVMGALFQHAKRVVWLDHHASVFKDWGVPLDDVADELTIGLVQPNDHTVVIDKNKSGAMLAWEYFHPGTEVPMVIRHIDDRYRRQFKLGGSKEFHAATSAAISELLDRLEAAEKAVNEAYQRGYETGQEEIETELAELRSSMKFRTSLIGRTEAERDALRAKIEQMEKRNERP